MFGFFRKRRYAKLNEKARKLAAERPHENLELRPRESIDPFKHPTKLDQFHERSRDDRRSGEERRHLESIQLLEEERRRTDDRRSGEDRRHRAKVVMETNYQGRQTARIHRRGDERLQELEDELQRLKGPPLDAG